MKQSEIDEIIRQVAYRCGVAGYSRDQRDRAMFQAGMLAAADLESALAKFAALNMDGVRT